MERTCIFSGHFPARLRQRVGSGLICAPVSAKFLGMTEHSPIPFPGTAPIQVHFNRAELALILGLYGRMVAAGEWRDYGISGLKEVAVFAVFRRTAENPLYRIEKRPKLARAQGQYAIIAEGGQILKRGNELKTVLRVLERKLIRSVT